MAPFPGLKPSPQKHWQPSRLVRWFSFLALFLISAGLIIAHALSQPITLRVLMAAPDVPPWNAVMVKAFEQQNPGVRLQIIEGPNATNLIEDLYTSAFLLGDSPYDLINMDVIWTPKFAAAGWLVDLTDEFSQGELAAFSAPDVEGGKYQGKLYRLPIRSDAGMLYYRTDLLEKAGYQPPQTFEELIKISKDLQSKGLVRWGYLWQGRQYEGAAAMFVEVLKGFGGYWVNPDTLEVGLDQPEAIRAVEFLLGTIREGVSPPGVTTYIEEDTRRIFQNGEAAFLRSWPYVWSLANADNSPIQGRLGIMPMIPSKGNEGGSCLGGWGLGISKTSRHRKEALQAIRFLTQGGPQKQFILEAGYVPSRRDLFTESDIVAKYNYFPQFLEVVQRAVLRPPIAQYAQASDILQRYLSAALTNQITAERAMQEAARETRLLLEAGRRNQAA